MATTSALHGQAASDERFNAEAAGWDSNPFVHEATNAAYKALRQIVPALQQNDQSINVLEIGCGTGLLTVQIARHVNHVVAVDAAQGMINVLQTKLTQPDAATNITPLAILLEDPEDSRLPASATSSKDGTDPSSNLGERLKYDLILSHLVLHHIPDLKPVLTTMLGCLKPGGSIALTDFEDFGPEARKFHPQSRLKGVERDGIKRDWIAGLLKEVGFKDVQIMVGFTISKEVEKYEGEFGDQAFGAEGQGEMMDFPFLVCMGRR